MTDCAVIVDDDFLIVAYLEEALESLGWKVCGTAATAAAAVRTVLEHRPRFVLMDVRLKGREDGIDAADRIYGEYPCPIIFITGSREPETMARIHQGHPAGVLTKPIMPGQLGRAIEQALGARSS